MGCTVATAEYMPYWAQQAAPPLTLTPTAVSSTSLRRRAILGDRYKLLERIGSGGSATVYRAQDLARERTVALKVLHPRLAGDDVITERFRREAHCARRLVHEHIVRIHDNGVYGGRHYIAMEHLPGRPLKAIIKCEGPLPPPRAVGITIQVLEAAGFAHDHGVIHRDLKPENIIVGPRDWVKVTDFGIAFEGQTDLTPTGSVLGTVGYLSPEQIMGRRVTPACDLYSVGIILYELLTGRLPFEGEHAINVALKHVNARPASPARFNDAISPELNALILRALSKAPSRRPPDASAFIRAVARVNREART
jgi:eukaryotic-like serine/threonine-protein kinase